MEKRSFKGITTKFYEGGVVHHLSPSGSESTFLRSLNASRGNEWPHHSEWL